MPLNASERGVRIAACGASLLFAVAAWIVNLKTLSWDGNGLRVLMVCVPGLSWEDIGAMACDRSCSAIREILGDRTCWASLRLSGEKPEAIAASLLTGRFPSSHGVITSNDLTSFDGFVNPSHRVIWDVLGQMRRHVVAAGWPLWYPIAEKNVLIMGPEECLDSEISKGVIPSRPDDSDETAQRCMQRDIRAVQKAVAGLQKGSESDVFLFLSGLEEWGRLNQGGLATDHEATVARLQLLRNLDCLIQLVRLANNPGKTLLVIVGFPSQGSHPSLDGGKGDSIRMCDSHSGIFLASGPDVCRGPAAGVIRDIDVAPMIIYRLGLRVPIDVDGAPWNTILGETHGIHKALLFSK